MARRGDELWKRFNELRTQRFTSRKAAKMINSEFNVTMTDVTIRSYANRYKKKLAKLSRVPTARNITNATHPKTPGQVKKRSAKTVDELLPALTLDERIRAVAREVFQEMLDDMRNDTDIIRAPEDVPPEPETVKKAGKGRRENRDYVKASVTIDRILWDLLVNERDRLRVSTGRVLDIILWRHYNRPKLSFEQ